jgi:hypothetical protein
LLRRYTPRNDILSEHIIDNRQFLPVSPAAAAFEFFAAAARTGCIAGCGFQPVLLIRLPQTGGTPGKIGGIRLDMFEQHFPGSTKLALAIVAS